MWLNNGGGQDSTREEMVLTCIEEVEAFRVPDGKETFMEFLEEHTIDFSEHTSLKP